MGLESDGEFEPPWNGKRQNLLDPLTPFVFGAASGKICGAPFTLTLEVGALIMGSAHTIEVPKYKSSTT